MDLPGYKDRDIEHYEQNIYNRNLARQPQTARDYQRS